MTHSTYTILAQSTFSVQSCEKCVQHDFILYVPYLPLPDMTSPAHLSKRKSQATEAAWEVGLNLSFYNP